jgi:uncharacterized membrane protein YdjX (TVP38/TMEM64 family)
MGPIGASMRLRAPVVTVPTDQHRIEASAPRRRGALWRFAPLGVVIMLVGMACAFGLHREVSFENFIRHRAAIEQAIAAQSVAALAGYVALYVVAVGLSLPAGGILTTLGGFLFGPFLGALAALVGAVIGATVIFLVARSAVGEFLTRRAGPFAARLAEGFRADAFHYLLFLRLVPLFPFALVNLAPALFNVPLRTFVTATAIGIVPATTAFAIFGAGLGSVVSAQEVQYNACMAAGRAGCGVALDLSHVLTPTILAAMAALGVLVLVPVFARRIWGRKLGVGLSSKRH